MKRYAAFTVLMAFLHVVVADDSAIVGERTTAESTQRNNQSQPLTASPSTISPSATSPSTTSPSTPPPANDKHPTLRVVLNGLTDEVLQKNAEQFLDLYQERDKPVENPSYTQFLIRTGVEQLQNALQPFGYYLARVESRLIESNNQWHVTYTIDKGKPVIISNRDVSLRGEGSNDSNFVELVDNYPLNNGDRLEQEKYTSFKNDIKAVAVDDGYFDGTFTRKEIVLADNLQGADITIVYDTGIRYAFGETTIKQDILDQDVFDRYKTFKPGDKYSSQSVAELQRDLYNSGYVKVIDVTAEPNKETKTVPVELAITPKKNKKHTFALGYGTDTGARARYDFDWRWVNRRGHSFKSKIFVSEKLIDSGLEYHIPAEHPATDYYKIFANYKQTLDGDIDSALWNIGGAYRDQQGHLTREFGVKFQQEDFSIGNDSGKIDLLTPYVKLTYLKADDLLAVNDGIKAELEITGAHKNVLSDETLLQAVAKGKYIKRLNDAHKVSVAGAIGRTWTDDFHALPTAYRFFTGGDRTVRGYTYNAIGDQDSSGETIGGDKMYFMSAEYEYFFNDTMAVATFVDAGDAYSADSARLKVGAGLGFHYYSPIGPIKVDVAHGFHEPGDDVRLHLTIGSEL